MTACILETRGIEWNKAIALRISYFLFSGELVYEVTHLFHKHKAIVLNIKTQADNEVSVLIGRHLVQKDYIKAYY